MTKKIEFIDSWENTPEEFFPTPASKILPDWYKKTSSYMNNDKELDVNKITKKRTNSTIKKCRPVFDAISSGYLLRLPVDLEFEREGNSHSYYWPSKKPLEFHFIEQLLHYPGQENRTEAYPKLLHPWIIKTPPGYSTLFVNPIHHPSPINILEGIVDTDSYHDVVNLPFYVKDTDFNGVMKAGTPIAQVIPIKRESWSMVTRRANEKDLDAQHKVATKIVSVFSNGYQKFFWNKKEYR